MYHLHWTCFIAFGVSNFCQTIKVTGLSFVQLNLLLWIVETHSRTVTEKGHWIGYMFVFWIGLCSVRLIFACFYINSTVMFVIDMAKMTIA